MILITFQYYFNEDYFDPSLIKTSGNLQALFILNIIYTLIYLSSPDVISKFSFSKFLILLTLLIWAFIITIFLTYIIYIKMKNLNYHML